MTQARDELRHLVPRQLSAFARLGALHDLDLELLGPHQVLGGDAEPRRCHLLDPVVEAVAFRQRAEERGILAALA